tara:strand:- start:114 stop:764 length:651 start_codon:yes stop_codon:yes gene_type:complete
MPASKSLFKKVGFLENNRSIKSLQNLSSTQVTMGQGVPRQSEGGIGDITVREIPSVGLLAYIKTNQGWVDINQMTPMVPAEWRDMVLTNSWVVYGTDVDSPQFIKDDLGFVHLKGVVKNGSSATAAITALPESYRPSFNQYRLVFNTDYADPAINELSTIKIDTNGVITQSDGTNTAALFLTGISFHAGQIISSQGHGGGGGAPIEGKEDTGGGVG